MISVMITTFSRLPENRRRSFTVDYGNEFFGLRDVEKAINMPVFYANPYSPWQRGTNENTNGLIRQYFPKKFDFLSVSQSHIDAIVSLLNHRPRKVLGFAAPFEFFYLPVALDLTIQVMKTGMFIDIFPLDIIPDFYKTWLVHCFECFVLRKILYSEVEKGKEKSCIKRTVSLLLNHIPKEFVFRRFDIMSKRWNQRNTKYNRTMAFPPRIWDEEVIEILFEGHQFLTTAHYKTYLAWRYGDYMQLPLPEKRHWHQATKIVFLEE